MYSLKSFSRQNPKWGLIFSAAPPSNWILATGFWNDAGVWDDAAVWID